MSVNHRRRLRQRCCGVWGSARFHFSRSMKPNVTWSQSIWNWTPQLPLTGTEAWSQSLQCSSVLKLSRQLPLFFLFFLINRAETFKGVKEKNPHCFILKWFSSTSRRNQRESYTTAPQPQLGFPRTRRNGEPCHTSIKNKSAVYPLFITAHTVLFCRPWPWRIYWMYFEDFRLEWDICHQIKLWCTPLLFPPQ